MNDNWYRATRRLWVAAVIRWFLGALVISPIVATFALGIAHVFRNPQLGGYLMWAFGVAANLAVLLWSIRQALLKTYPEGAFVLRPNEGAPKDV